MVLEHCMPVTDLLLLTGHLVFNSSRHLLLLLTFFRSRVYSCNMKTWSHWQRQAGNVQILLSGPPWGSGWIVGPFIATQLGHPPLLGSSKQYTFVHIQANFWDILRSDGCLPLLPAATHSSTCCWCLAMASWFSLRAASTDVNGITIWCRHFGQTRGSCSLRMNPIESWTWWFDFVDLDCFIPCDACLTTSSVTIVSHFSTKSMIALPSTVHLGLEAHLPGALDWSLACSSSDLSNMEWICKMYVEQRLPFQPGFCL